MQENTSFDVEKWKRVIALSISAFTGTEYALEDPVDLERAFPPIRVKYDEDISELDEEDDVFISGAYEAIEVIPRQYIILIYTYVEVMLEEFLYCLFIFKPQSMYDFVDSQDNLKGKVDLKRIIDTASKEDLLTQLAISSSRNAGRGTISETIKRVERLVGSKIEDKLKNGLVELAFIRNQIVHENPQNSPVNSNEVISSCLILLNLLKTLYQFCMTNNIPVRKRSRRYEVLQISIDVGN